MMKRKRGRPRKTQEMRIEEAYDKGYQSGQDDGHQSGYREGAEMATAASNRLMNMERFKACTELLRQAAVSVNACGQSMHAVASVLNAAHACLREVPPHSPPPRTLSLANQEASDKFQPISSASR